MNVNGRKSDMAAQNLQNLRNLQNLQKTDKSGLVGEPQEATAADNRPEGETEVDKTVIVTYGGDGDGSLGNKGVFYDGIDNGVVVYIREDGSLLDMTIDDDLHNRLRDNPNSKD